MWHKPELNHRSMYPEVRAVIRRFSSLDRSECTHEELSQHDFTATPLMGRVFSGISIPQRLQGTPEHQYVFKNCRFDKQCSIQYPRASHIRFENCQFCGLIEGAEKASYSNCEFASEAFLKLEHPLGANGNNVKEDFRDEVAFSCTGCSFFDFNFPILREHIYVGLKFFQCRFSGKIERVLLDASSFVGSDLRGVAFEESSLRSTSFRWVDFNSETSFKNCNVEKLQVSRLNLNAMKDFGGLSQYELKHMDIRHDLADLRASFSGFMQWLHVAALLLFLSPIIWFVCQKLVSSAALTEGESAVNRLESWADSKPFGSTEAQKDLKDKIAFYRASINTVQERSLRDQLIFYIVSGGRTNDTLSPDWTHIGLFVFFLFYNGFRAYLLFKTKQHEHEELVTELPSDFAFTEHPWIHRIFKTTQRLIPVNIAVGVINLYLYSLRDFPV
jgi:uncharacterized protein YjbI with pentapeptide repeats